MNFSPVPHWHIRQATSEPVVVFGQYKFSLLTYSANVTSGCGQFICQYLHRCRIFSWDVLVHVHFLSTLFPILFSISRCIPIIFSLYLDVELLTQDDCDHQKLCCQSSPSKTDAKTCNGSWGLTWTLHKVFCKYFMHWLGQGHVPKIKDITSTCTYESSGQLDTHSEVDHWVQPSSCYGCMSHKHSNTKIEHHVPFMFWGHTLAVFY